MKHQGFSRSLPGFDLLGVYEPRRHFGVTATLIALAATSAISGVAKAKIESNAANKAADIQQQGSQKAMDFAKQMWGQSQQSLNPFVQNGQTASNMLGSLLRAPGTPGAYHPGTSYAPPPTMGPPQPLQGAPIGMPQTFQGSFPGAGQPQAPAPQPSAPNPYLYGAMGQFIGGR